MLFSALKGLGLNHSVLETNYSNIGGREFSILAQKSSQMWHPAIKNRCEDHIMKILTYLVSRPAGLCGAVDICKESNHIMLEQFGIVQKTFFAELLYLGTAGICFPFPPNSKDSK